MTGRANTMGSGNPLPLTFDLIDLDAHPDGALLRACAQATKLRDKLGADGGIGKRNVRSSEQDAYFRALDLITNTEALTHLGLLMKAVYAMGGLSGISCLAGLLNIVMRLPV
jgi:hypothetical protein